MTHAMRYLEALKAYHGSITDYRAAKILGVTHQAVSNWQQGKASFSTINAERVGKALEIDPDEVVIATQIDHAKTPEERAIWERILKKVAGASALLLLALALVAPYSDAIAAPGTICIMSTCAFGLFYARVLFSRLHPEGIIRALFLPV